MDRKPFRTQTKSMPCKLTIDEVLGKGQELAQTIQDVNDEEDRQKNLKEQMKASLSELTARQTRLSLVVSRREEYRDVEVQTFMLDSGMVQEVRMDTGEVVINRPPRDDERQFRLGAD